MTRRARVLLVLQFVFSVLGICFSVTSLILLHVTSP
jgi:hypothetical protein